MVYDFDPRTNRENLNSKSYPRRLLEDIITNKIVDSMSFGTASNYLTRSYGPNHRVIYEGVGRLLSGLLVDTLDNLEDVEYSQLRAEFVATRLMYLVFPDEDSVPVGDTHEETISFLLQTYEALLKGATKKSVDEVLNDIAEGNAVVVSDVEGYIANIKSSILATTEYNTDGVFRTHRHFAFTDESGLGSTNKPIEYKWGDELHTHDIIDGVIQPHIDVDGNSHSHEVYLGIPEEIIRLQSNLRKVLNITKPAHIKTGEIASIIDEDIPILAQGKGDVFSPILGINPTQTDGQIIESNKIDSTLPYYNQNAQYGLVGVALGSLYQEDMRKAREGVYEEEFYGYASGNTIRVWRTNIQVADNLIISDDNPNTQDQKFRVISVESGIKPGDDIYQKITGSDGMVYTIKTVRDLNRGASSSLKKITLEDVEIINGSIYPIEEDGIREGQVGNTQSLNDGEPIFLRDKVYFCELKADLGQYLLDLGLVREPNMSGHRIGLVATVITVDSRVQQEGLIKFKNNSSPWNVRDELQYETTTFTNTYDARWGNYNYAINIPNFIVKEMLKSIGTLPVSMNDITIKIDKGNGFVDPDYSYSNLFLESINWYTYSDKDGIMRINDRTRDVLGDANYNDPLISQGDEVQITYPKSKSEIRRFRELNSLEMTLNATRPARKVSLSGRNGVKQKRVVETTSPISYVLNEPQPISPSTQEQKTATYSAGSSDLLNTQNQNLNTSYTLNNFSLNQTATQEQVFKPASNTVKTDNPKISFYQLGFRPSYITSVVDSEGVSYSYNLNKDHVFVDGITNEKTLTLSGISSNPFDSDLDWYKGEKLAEGQAFFRHTGSSDLSKFRESTPESYMTNPLGIASKILDTFPKIDPIYTYTNNVITGVEVHGRVLVTDSSTRVDEIRSVYSMLNETISGVEGELTFYEDKVTDYELDGVGGFTNEYNPHNPLDEWLYPDPSLYILGPTSIPTHFFFGYNNLTTSGGDGFYFSLYRIDAQGYRQYQTLSLRADSNGFTALEEHPNPVPNGPPLAYRFKDDSLASPNTIDYDNAPAPNFLAQINASINHLANETYFLELYMEEDNGADYLYFLTSGTDADFDLESSWATSPHAYRLDQSLVGTVNNVSYIYEITFTLNPGEIQSFTLLGTDNPQTINLVENNAEEIGYSANDNYPIPRPAIDLSWKSSFETTGFIFSSVDDRIPSISDSLNDLIMNFLPVNQEDIISIPTDAVSTSLLLYPADITQSVGEITDDLTTHLNYVVVREEDVVGAITANLNYTYILANVNLEPDNVGSISDSIEFYLRLYLTENVVSIIDSLEARVSGFGVSDVVPLTSESMLVSYSFLPKSPQGTIPSISDDVSVTKSLEDLNINGTVLPPSDNVLAYITSSNPTGVVSVTDDLNVLIKFTIDGNDTLPSVIDSVIVPRYQTIVPLETVASPTDAVATSLLLSFSDSTPSISDTLDLGQAITLTPDTLTFNADVIAFISSTSPSDSLSVSDDLTTQINIQKPSAMLAIKYNATSNGEGEYFTIYKGSMESVEYPTIHNLGVDSNAISPLSISSNQISASLNVQYTNANEDANLRIGPIEYNQTFKIFALSSDVDNDSDIAIAGEVGNSTVNPNNYLDGVSYHDLMPGSNIANGLKYYIHEFYLDSSLNTYVFTQDTTPKDALGVSNTTITVYAHLKYTNSAIIDDSDTIVLREAQANATHSSPNPTGIDEGIAPNINTTDAYIDGQLVTFSDFVNRWRVTAGQAFNTQTNQIETAPNGTPYYYETELPNDSITNYYNDAQLNWELVIGKRYLIELKIGDHSFNNTHDMSLYLEARADDNGASWDTEYDGSSSVTYTELATAPNNPVNDGTQRMYYYFFTVREDGFIQWEHHDY